MWQYSLQISSKSEIVMREPFSESGDLTRNDPYKYLNRVYFDCKTKLCFDRQGKYIFSQESFYLQGILNDINEQDTSLLDCKHKHMMKSGAPPDKIGVLHLLLSIEFHGFTSRIAF